MTRKERIKTIFMVSNPFFWVISIPFVAGLVIGKAILSIGSEANEFWDELEDDKYGRRNNKKNI